MYRRDFRSSTLLAATFLFCTLIGLAQKPKLIIDQDARGPANTDINAILMFAQSKNVDVLGVTLVTGDQWVKEETAHTLRALEIAGRSDIPVYVGAGTPLVNTKEEMGFWEDEYGEFAAKG